MEIVLVTGLSSRHFPVRETNVQLLLRRMPGRLLPAGSNCSFLTDQPRPSALLFELVEILENWAIGRISLILMFLEYDMNTHKTPRTRLNTWFWEEKPSNLVGREISPQCVCQ